MIELFKSPLFLLFVGLTSTSIIGTIAHYWYKARKTEIEAALKQDMIRQGMSADDIVKVVEATKSRKYDEDEEESEKPCQAARG